MPYPLPMPPPVRDAPRQREADRWRRHRRAASRVALALLLLPTVVHAQSGDGAATEPPGDGSSEAAPSPSAPWPDHVGPFELATDGDAARLRVGLMAQLRLTVDDRQTGSGRETGVDLSIARIRPNLRAVFLDGRIETVLQLNVSPGALELIDLFVDATIVPELRVRVGQFKTPFTLYRQQSFAEQALNDWPITTRWFGAERQLGVMAHDSRCEHGGFGYALGVFAGQNRRAGHARELPRVYGERPVNPSDLASPALGELHPELVGRIQHMASGAHPETNFDASGGDALRHAVALSAAWDVDPVYREDFLVRVAPELLLKWNGLGWTMIAYVGLSERLDGSVILASVGGFAELTWQPDRHLQLALRYARVQLADDLRGDARAYAASIEPADPIERAAWEAQYGSVGHVHARQELGLGVTVPVIGRGLAWQSDVSWLRAERTDGERDDVEVRTQVQLAF